MFSFAPAVHALETYQVDTFWIVNGILGMTSGFASFEVANHHDKTTTINVPVTLIP